MRFKGGLPYSEDPIETTCRITNKTLILYLSNCNFSVYIEKFFLKGAIVIFIGVLTVMRPGLRA